MAINILDIQPSAINRSLSGKSILLAGEPKIGKSEFCAQSPDTLILDFENGYNMHFGVKKVNVTKWSDVKLIVRQLEKAEAQTMYKNVVIDTLNEAWDLCTDFICSQNSVQKIKDIPYGQGYKDRDSEFASTLRKIMNLGYGLIVTCHTKTSVIGTDGDIDITAIAPDLDKRCVPIINGLVDIMGMITKTWNKETQSWDRWLYTKSTPTISAGTRLKYLAEKIPFGYAYLEDAVVQALEENAKHGAQIIDGPTSAVEETINFNKVRAEAQELWTQLVTKDENNAAIILKKIEMIMGHKMKLSEFSEDQADLLNLAVLEMRDIM